MDEKGQVLWEADLPYPRDARNWNIRDDQPAWRLSWPTPLLVSGDRLLASITHARSGISWVHVLELSSGKSLWGTGDGRTLALDSHGNLLKGVQGYGAFETFLYSLSGECLGEWPTHGDMVVTEEGEVRLLEMENSSTSRLCVASLQPDGQVRRGPPIDGYYSGEPVISRQGIMYLWRKDAVYAVGPDLQPERLFQAPASHDALSQRNLWSSTALQLTPSGALVFGLGRELWICRGNFGPPARSAWACDEANPGGNPVFQPRHRK